MRTAALLPLPSSPPAGTRPSSTPSPAPPIVLRLPVTRGQAGKASPTCHHLHHAISPVSVLVGTLQLQSVRLAVSFSLFSSRSTQIFRSHMISCSRLFSFRGSLMLLFILPQMMLSWSTWCTQASRCGSQLLGLPHTAPSPSSSCREKRGASPQTLGESSNPPSQVNPSSGSGQGGERQQLRGSSRSSQLSSSPRPGLVTLFLRKLLLHPRKKTLSFQQYVTLTRS